MLKLGAMHAMLLDMASEPRRPRVADAFVQAVAPFDSGLTLLSLLERFGLLDAAQRDWLRRRTFVDRRDD